MQDVEKLQLVYAEKENAYQNLVGAYNEAMDAANAIKSMCDKAMDEKLKAGEELLKAMKAQA